MARKLIAGQAPKEIQSTSSKQHQSRIRDAQGPKVQKILDARPKDDPCSVIARPCRWNVQEGRKVSMKKPETNAALPQVGAEAGEAGPNLSDIANGSRASTSRIHCLSHA